MKAKTPSLKVFFIFTIFVLVCSIQCVSAAAKERDPYKVLGVERDASEREIKQAYKRLVMKWHPDKSSNPKATSMFMSISEAYKLLSDPEKKKLYDRYGTTEEMPSFTGYRQQSYGHQRQSFQRMPHGFPFNNFHRYDDPFEHVFQFTFGNHFQEVPRSSGPANKASTNQQRSQRSTSPPTWFDRAFSMFE